MMLDPCDVAALGRAIACQTCGRPIEVHPSGLACPPFVGVPFDPPTTDGADLTPEEEAAIETAGRMIAAELHDGSDIGVREVSTGPSVALDTMAPPTMVANTEPTLPSMPDPQLAPVAVPPGATPVRIRRVRLNASHRGASGHYYGPGAPVWEWTHPGATPADARRFVRAHDVDAAVRAVQAEHPVASVEIMPDV